MRYLPLRVGHQTRSSPDPGALGPVVHDGADRSKKRRAASASQALSGRRGPRILAVAAMWFVLAGVLAGRHDAEVGHVRDGASGVVMHAEAVMVERHVAGAAHVHQGVALAGHALDGCVLAAAHDRAAMRVSPRGLTLAARVIAVRGPFAAPPPTTLAARLRFAPKTSPPMA